MSPPDRPPVTEKLPSAARREDGAAPRSRAERLLMLCLLVAICLAVSIPTLVVTGIFGQRPKPKAPPPAAQATPTPGDGLTDRAKESANVFLPDPGALGPEPITVTVRPEHLTARLETVRRQAAQFGGTATEGVPSGNEKVLFVDLPAAATAAFRQAVTPATPAPPPAATPSGQDHITVIIRPAGDDE